MCLAPRRASTRRSRRPPSEARRHAAIEVTSEALAKGFAKRWRFDIGVFTNLTRDHLDAHGTWEHYLASKAQLFAHLPPGGAAVLNGCDEVAPLLDRVTPAGVRRIFYGSTSRGKPRAPLDLAVQRVALRAEGTTIDLEPSALAEQLGSRLQIQLVGEVFAENALAAACAAVHAGVSGADVARGLAACPVVPAGSRSCTAAPSLRWTSLTRPMRSLARARPRVRWRSVPG